MQQPQVSIATAGVTTMSAMELVQLFAAFIAAMSALIGVMALIGKYWRASVEKAAIDLQVQATLEAVKKELAEREADYKTLEAECSRLRSLAGETA